MSALMMEGSSTDRARLMTLIWSRMSSQRRRSAVKRSCRSAVDIDRLGHLVRNKVGTAP